MYIFILKDIQTPLNLYVETVESIFVDVDIPSRVVIITYWRFPT